MKNTFRLMQVLDNLARIPRSGGVLFAGLNAQNGDSLAEHSYKVTWICLLFTARLKKEGVQLDEGNLLKYAITHDWGEAVLLDVPSGSPSYKSYFEEDIREVMKKAEARVSRAIDAFIAPELSLNTTDIVLSDTEKSVFTAADITAILIEILEWRYQGLKYEWFNYIWANTLERLRDLLATKLPQLTPFINELVIAYKENSKQPNPFLTKQQFQHFNHQENESANEI